MSGGDDYDPLVVTTTPRPIRKLPLSLVNRIAAGEVIERPASVVKELVENAIDAGSTSITVEIEDGGLSLIRVIDDGCGISPEQLPLALAEHATSKLVDDDDLFRISTKGFRGEAVASIASISHFRILSRTAGEVAAYEITSNGGTHGEPQAAAGNTGTTVEVRNLFFNVPARRKFMKGPGTEFGHISEMVLKLALPHPNVEFNVFHNGRASLKLPRTDPVERLLEAWPDSFREQRLPLEASDAEIRISGIIGLPELAHQTAKYQYLYVNGRPIRDKYVGHALKEAYRGLTEPGRQPAAVLLIEVPPEDVDVNVHPTKVEVRFKNSGRIHGLVMSGVREVLLSHDLAPKAKPEAVGGGGGNIEPVSSGREGLMKQLAEFFKSPATPTHTQHLLDLPPRNTPSETSAPVFTRDAVLPAVPSSEVVTSPSTRSSSESLSKPTSVSIAPNSPVYEEAEPPAPAVPMSEVAQPKPQTPTAPLSPPTTSPAAPATLSQISPSLPALQLHNTYLVVETPEGMQIIDQHALHERILFEELFARITRGPLESQRMLIPATLSASDRQIDLVDQIRPLLERLGIEITSFGPRQLAILGFPSFLSKLDPVEFVTALLEKGEQEILDLSEEELLHDVLDMMACKAAVKAGDPLTPQQIDALLLKRHLVDRTSNCPHGRPTTLKLSLKDLEKQFKRTGF